MRRLLATLLGLQIAAYLTMCAFIAAHPGVPGAAAYWTGMNAFALLLAGASGLVFSRRRAILSGAVGFLGRFRGSEGGNVILIFALGLPALLLFGVGAVDLSALYSDKAKTQDVADAAALEGANQLSASPTGAASRAQAYAVAQLDQVAAHSTVTVSASSPGPGMMKVSIDTHRLSFFGNLLPPGGWYTHAEATARAEADAPLCVLATGNTTANDDLHMSGASQLQALKCLVQSNRNLLADAGSTIVATTASAVGTASGAIVPAASTGAAAIADPFTSLPLSPPTNCNSEVTSVPGGSTVTLQPGLHCTALNIANKGTVILAPGVHWFKADITFGNKAAMDGTAGAALVFLSPAKINMSGNSAKKVVNLRGAKSGPLAGFVIATTRDYTSDFTIPADAINELTGTVYVPSAKLIVDGTTALAQTSPWTVIVAKGLNPINTADVFMNTNYTGVDVPVPMGVGNNSRVRLSK